MYELENYFNEHGNYPEITTTNPEELVVEKLIRKAGESSPEPPSSFCIALCLEAEYKSIRILSRASYSNQDFHQAETATLRLYSTKNVVQLSHPYKEKTKLYIWAQT